MPEGLAAIVPTHVPLDCGRGPAGGQGALVEQRFGVEVTTQPACRHVDHLATRQRRRPTSNLILRPG